MNALGAPPVPSREFLARIPHEFARRHLILSTGSGRAPHAERASTARADRPVERLRATPSTNPAALFNVGVCLGRAVAVEHAESELLAAKIDEAYAAHAAQEAANGGGCGADGSPGEPRIGARTDQAPAIVIEGSSDLAHDLAAALRETERDLLNTRGKAPVVRLVDLLLFEALLREASDLHVVPLRDRTLVRYRVDGSLHTVQALPANLAGSVTTRIKVMAAMDVADKRSAQDGRATVTIGSASSLPLGGIGGATGRRIDLRISTLPTTYGERVVIRLLDPVRSPHLQSFAALGMPEATQARYLAQIAKPHGIVLSTGPTGSGKTTTLYATLNWLTHNHSDVSGKAAGCDINMMTIEDPVEYDLSDGAGTGRGLAVSQTQVDPKKEVTFATGLRHILRQDPDVIMVGEVRDEATARIAVQASLTGHLVLSTLHTNDAASAVARLLDLGVEPFLVASSLSAVLAQRLVRTFHAECAANRTSPTDLVPMGCPGCLHTGFKGRRAIFELLVVDERIRQLIVDRAPSDTLKGAAERAGMVSLRRAGLAVVSDGLTSMEEVARVIDVSMLDVAQAEGATS
ncbi:MAG: GspE/PulE family protein [Phycisphaerales bacterium]